MLKCKTLLLYYFICSATLLLHFSTCHCRGSLVSALWLQCSCVSVSIRQPAVISCHCYSALLLSPELCYLLCCFAIAMALLFSASTHLSISRSLSSRAKRSGTVGRSVSQFLVSTALSLRGN